MTKNSPTWMTPGDTHGAPGDWSWMHQEKKDLPNSEGWMQPSRPSLYTKLRMNSPVWDKTNQFALLSCDDDQPATTSKPGLSCLGYYNNQKRDQPPQVKEQMCSQTLDHSSPQKRNIDCHELVSGPECNGEMTHGRWSSETTRPLEILSETKFLRNFYQYWLERGGREVKDPLKKTLQALRQVTVAGIESTCKWTGKLM
jgi:hypothetical protein